MRVTALLLAFMVCASPPGSAAEQLVDEPNSRHGAPSIWERERLLDHPGGPREALRAAGINVEAQLTQFYQGILAGDGDRDGQYGGKGDLIVTFDGGKLGLWPGLFVNFHQEWQYGDDANFQGDGSLIPLNTALGFPRLGGRDAETSLVITQAFGPGRSISVGKFNLLDLAAETPLLGGGGLSSFMNLGLAAPISGVTPPYILGAIGSYATPNAIFTAMIYDPRNAQDDDVLENPFEDGVTTALSVTVPTHFGGLPGFYGVTGIYSSAEGFDLARVPELAALPPGAAGQLTKNGYWFGSASIQQFLYVDPSDPSKGWGIFGQVGLSDGNPNAVAWSFLAGFGGNSFIPGRNVDRWGIAYFHYGLSDDLIDGLRGFGIDLNDEQGIEAFYTVAVTPWLDVSADIQWIDPHEPQRPNAVIGALRMQTRF